MKMNTKLTTMGLLATLAAASVSPVLADGYQSRTDLQNNKNTMRNLGIAGAAVAVLGLVNHNNTLALLGAAGGALAGSQYEQDRQQQSQDNSRYFYRDGRNRDNTWNQNDRNRDYNWTQNDRNQNDRR
jgi:hypothetical protein